MAKEKQITNTEMRRYLGALNEQHSENLKAMREGFDVINKTLASHTETLASHTEMIGKLMVDMTEAKSDISVLKKDVKEIKSDLKQKADTKDLRKLETRVVRLEAKAH